MRSLSAQLLTTGMVSDWGSGRIDGQLMSWAGQAVSGYVGMLNVRL